MLGYYKSSFPKKDGNGKAYYALTQFEPCEQPVHASQTRASVLLTPAIISPGQARRAFVRP